MRRQKSIGETKMKRKSRKSIKKKSRKSSKSRKSRKSRKCKKNRKSRKSMGQINGSKNGPTWSGIIPSLSKMVQKIRKDALFMAVLS